MRFNIADFWPEEAEEKMRDNVTPDEEYTIWDFLGINEA